MWLTCVVDLWGRMSKRQYLQQRHQTWYVVLEVPKKLRTVLGRRFVRSLQTQSLDEADRKKHAVIAQMKRQITALAKTPNQVEAKALVKAMNYRREYAPMVAAFREGLKETGYVEGHNVEIEYRWANGQYNRLTALADDLVRRQVSIISANTLANLVAKAATSTIPDKVRTGDQP
jgi:Domain of unknown function (DUF6538)